MSTDVPSGFEPVQAEEGGFAPALGSVWMNRAIRRLGWRPDHRHVNGPGVCHGGMISALADSQILALPRDMVPHYPPTINLAVDYLSPLPIGAWAELETTLDKLTRGLVFTSARITVGDRLIARSTAIYRVRSDAPPAGEQ